MDLRSEAVVLRRVPFRDNSLVVTFHSREYGQISLAALGVRQNKGMARAALAGFHTVLLLGRTRRLENMGTMTGAEIIKPRHRLYGCRQAAAAAQLILEGIYRYFPPSDPQPQPYHLLEESLDLLEAAELDPLAVTVVAQGRLLREMGFGWRVNGCLVCGSTTALDYFSPRRGQVVCRPCGAPHVARLLPLTPALGRAMDELAWRGAINSLSWEEKVVYYQIGQHCLTRFGGRPLLADGSFRLCFGISEG